ncbi:MAG: zinc ribbon domain-containing protein, partial [Candidatus Gracilibacteria bacterium]|nr:zinc ribbon domain-containing protein [Candidatus Gracilibacteria bacterium]
CNSCGFENDNSALFCSECGYKINSQKNGENIDINSGEKEIELNLDFSFIKKMGNNQKYMLIFSGVILISFFMPFFSVSGINKSLFDIGNYFWIVFFLPIIFFAIQYYYNALKINISNKGLGQIIIIILSSMILSIYLLFYFGVEQIKNIASLGLYYNSDFGFTIGFVLSIISFIGILLLSIIETLNIFKKFK